MTSRSSTAKIETILVIDDDDDVRRTLVRMLTSAGYQTLEASDGSAAIHLFGDRSREITAVTLDLVMPTTDGRETLQMLSAYAPNLPIVIATAYGPKELSGRVPGMRGVGYLQKPFTTAELTAELRRVIAECAGGAPGEAPAPKP